MNYNYHTHTFRCHHASGEDREYVEKAIAAGIKNFGFSDHVPYPFPHGYVSHIRMKPEMIEDYIDSITSLKKEYVNDINISIGFEAEYYKEFWEDLCTFLQPYNIDYLILGQHYVGNEISGPYSGNPTSDTSILTGYVDQVIEAINTNRFKYICHPDLINYTGDANIYSREMTRLCTAAKAVNIPLEINLLGFVDQRIYPAARFLQIASSVGNKFVFGYDAHNPDSLIDNNGVNNCIAFAERNNIVIDNNFII